MGISQLSHGTASALALIHLAFLTGHIGRPGTGLNPLRGQNNVQGASDMGAMPFHFPGYMRVDQPGNAEKWELAWNVEPGGLNRQLGLTTTEILSHAHPGGVRALYMMGENPMMSEPNLNLTRHHMQQLEFIVAQDLFINKSGAFADVFLPAVSWAEKDGTFTNTDRRVQRVRQALAPRGQCPPRLADHLRPGQAHRGPPGPPAQRRLGLSPPRRDHGRAGPASRRIMPASPTSASSRSGCRCRCGTNSTPACPTCSPRASRAGGASSTRWSSSRRPSCPTMNTPSS